MYLLASVDSVHPSVSQSIVHACIIISPPPFLPSSLPLLVFACFYLPFLRKWGPKVEESGRNMDELFD